MKKILTQGAYKFGKTKFPEFSRPSKQSFPYNLKLKPDVTNHLSSHFGAFLAELQNIFLRSMVTGSTQNPVDLYQQFTWVPL